MATATELHADIAYDPQGRIPAWLKFYRNLHWGWKLGLGLFCLVGAICLTIASGGGAAGVFSLLAEVAFGVGVGVGIYSLGALFDFYEFSLEGLGNAALDSFLASSLIAFIETGVNYLAYASRCKAVEAELVQETTIQDMPYSDMLQNEKTAYDGYSRHGWQGNYPGQSRGIRAGAAYDNKTGILPQGLYREFDINPAIRGVGRDGSRFVVSSDYVVYLTRDHYVTFYRIKP